MMPNARPLTEIFQELQKFLEEYQGTQQNLAIKAGVSQSTISRARAYRQRDRLSKGLLSLCNYAGIKTQITANALHRDPRENEVLIDALREVWDGSVKNAAALAKVIRSMKALCSPEH